MILNKLYMILLDWLNMVDTFVQLNLFHYFVSTSSTDKHTDVHHLIVVGRFYTYQDWMSISILHRLAFVRVNVFRIIGSGNISILKLTTMEGQRIVRNTIHWLHSTFCKLVHLFFFTNVGLVCNVKRTVLKLERL